MNKTMYLNKIGNQGIRNFAYACVACLILAQSQVLVAQSVNTNTLNVLEHGGNADGKTLNTQVIQSLIDSCSAKGGGTVYFPAGKYLTGTFVFKEGVTIYLEANATILGSQNLDDYLDLQPTFKALRTNQPTKQLIYAEKVNNIAIKGRGTIDGQGRSFEKMSWTDEGITRPHLIQFIECNNVLIEGITLRNSGAWMQHYLACDYLTIRGIKVYNHCNYNNDMLDIDGCHFVTVSDCIGDSDDDALTFKSTSPRACENITVTNCVFSSHCNAIKMGTESTGGFKNISISNCVVKPSIVETKFFGERNGLAGVALEMVDGGEMEGINISNIRIKGTTAPIFMRLGNRARPHTAHIPKPGIGTMQNIQISNILATEASPIGCAISGLPGHNIENVNLNNIDLQFVGGGEASHKIGAVPENEANYPESVMFDSLPAYGFYARHVKDITFQNLQLSYNKTETRPALAFDDVEDLTILGIKAERTADMPVINFFDTQGAWITDSRLEDEDVEKTGRKNKKIEIKN